jgi:carbon-monoxide dehydrogenase medium subunit
LKPAPFTLHRPTTLAQATALLHDLADEDARLIAGGQSLAPMMAFRLARPGHLIDLNGVGELAHLGESGGMIEIGALIRHVDIARKAIPGVTGDLLRAVLPHIAHHPIRTRGTFCGSLAHADPASEWCLTAATLDATLVAHSAAGRREIAARDYFAGAMATALRADEVLSSVRLPQLPEGARFAFREFSRRSGDFAIAAALVVFELREGLIAQARIGIGGAEDRPRRIPQGEAVLNGRKPSPELFAEAGAAVAAALRPMEDISTSAAYRRELAATLTERALEEAAR